jgi:hypothetical protein
MIPVDMFSDDLFHKDNIYGIIDNAIASSLVKARWSSARRYALGSCAIVSYVA